MSSKAKLCAPYQLRNKLLELLRAGPTTADALARTTGYSGNAMRERLADLQANGYATRQMQPRPQGGAHYLWNLTAAGHKLSSLPEAERYKAAPRDGTVRQTTTTSYPVIGRRDPLVSAFFGASASGMRSPSVDSAPAAAVEFDAAAGVGLSGVEP